MPYIPTTDEERQEMLKAIGVESIDELFADIPDGVRFRGRLNLPEGLSEHETFTYLKNLAAENVNVDDYVCFLGAGAYDHLLPAALESILGLNEFRTAYTPYQAEISQGVLQAMYEYQTMICLLTGLDVANASLYDGASSLGEACIMAAAATGRGNVVLSAGINPAYRTVAETYLQHQGIEVRVAPDKNGRTDPEALADLIDDDTAAVCVQQPNAYGQIEQMAVFSAVAKDKQALFVAVVDPISLGVLQPPAAYGADIAVGEGQPLGIPLSFGGPYLGFIASRENLVRRLPGRIVGRTQDKDGNPGFVLTLQAREQHIRRERATSNICTNQALMAIAATAYLALVGKEGLREIGMLCLQKANYAYKRILELPGWTAVYEGPFFKEFVVSSPVEPQTLNRALLEYKMIGGFPLARWNEAFGNAIMFCVTEARSREEIDRLVDALGEITRRETGADK